MDAESRPSKRARPSSTAIHLVQGNPGGATELEPVRWPPRTSLGLSLLELRHVLYAVQRPPTPFCALPKRRPREARLRRPELEGLARLPAARHENNYQGGPPARHCDGRRLATAHLGCNPITAEPRSWAAFTDGQARSNLAVQWAAFGGTRPSNHLLCRITPETFEGPANSGTSGGSKCKPGDRNDGRCLATGHLGCNSITVVPGRRPPRETPSTAPPAVHGRPSKYSTAAPLCSAAPPPKCPEASLTPTPRAGRSATRPPAPLPILTLAIAKPRSARHAVVRQRPERPHHLPRSHPVPSRRSRLTRAARRHLTADTPRHSATSVRPTPSCRGATLNQVGPAKAERRARQRNSSRSSRRPKVGYHQPPLQPPKRKPEYSEPCRRPEARSVEARRSPDQPLALPSRASSARLKQPGPAQAVAPAPGHRHRAETPQPRRAIKGRQLTQKTQRTKGRPNTRCSGRRRTAFETRATIWFKTSPSWRH